MKDPLLYRLLRPILIGSFKALYWPTIINKDSIPKKGRVLLAGTHVTKKDPFLLAGTTKRCVHFLAKDELFKAAAPFFRGLGAIPVNRRIKDKSVMPAAVNKLKEEKLIGIFPEGTTNKTDNLIMPFKSGVIRMSLEAKAPIVPFAIIGEYKIFKKSVKIIMGKPYHPETEIIEKEIKILEDKVIELLKTGVNNK